VACNRRTPIRTTGASANRARIRAGERITSALRHRSPASHAPQTRTTCRWPDLEPRQVQLHVETQAGLQIRQVAITYGNARGQPESSLTVCEGPPGPSGLFIAPRRRTSPHLHRVFEKIVEPPGAQNSTWTSCTRARCEIAISSADRAVSARSIELRQEVQDIHAGSKPARLTR